MNIFTRNGRTESTPSVAESGKLAVVIAGLKERLRTDYEARFPSQKRLVREILDEAETVAWLTPFPHLFLPDLVEAGIGQRIRTAHSPSDDGVDWSRAQAA